MAARGGRVRAACAALVGACGLAMAAWAAAPSQELPGARTTIPAEVRGPDGSTPLMWAVYRGDVAQVKKLLRAGAKVGDVNDYGASPMQMAATAGNTAILKLLLKAGANADSPNDEGQTALMLVARAGNVEAAKLLLEHGATVDARERWGEQTALMWASARRHPQMMELLISHGADVNARSAWRNWERHVTAESRAKRTNAGGLTPLMYAAREDCRACVEVLIKHHVDLDKPDPDGFAPVTIAIINDNWDIAKRLIEAGADVNQWDIYGQGPLYAAVVSSAGGGGGGFFGGPATYPDDPSNQATPMDVITLLLDKGANPNMQLFYRPAGRGGAGGGAARGATPLMAAAAEDNAELVKLLLAHGADPKLYQADGQTPIMAALSGRASFGGGGAANPFKAVEVLKLLHAAGTDVNFMAIQHHLLRTRGGTALHYAVRAGSKPAIQLLVSWGIDVNARDPDGLTALDYAMGRGYVPFLQQRQPPRLDLAKLLRADGATVELSKIPNWPPVGPPIGYEATIWPLEISDGLEAASTKYPPMYPPGDLPKFLAREAQQAGESVSAAALAVPVPVARR
ncbi:MAG TPA: ankyrin repeat domain-containing protein [Steroidobacteraceae bacterium]|nr:ankyrin repeat domain-containing protein [Steroidobacteraceae bacterium]